MAAKVQAMQGFMDYVTVVDGDTAYNTSAKVAAIVAAATAAIEFVAWEKTVPAQQLIRWGHGSAALPMNQGYMWLAFIDATTAFNVGIVSLCCQNAERTKTEYVKKMSDTLLHSTTDTSLATAALLDKQQMIAVPIMGPYVREDSRLQIRYTVDAAVAGTDAAGFAIPVTKFNI